MHGNVWQWCADDYYAAEEPTVVAAHLVGLLGGPFGQGSFLAATDLFRQGQVLSPGASVEVSRGGSWYNYRAQCQAAFRRRSVPSGRTGDVGFRLARVPVQ
jgi:formylglycine-generating enzyme required for sulfatase activity